MLQLLALYCASHASAALEGRRDHVYQAAMFDPLTAATMPPDKIVEMCDELIAAHGFEKDGGVLPDLDATATGRIVAQLVNGEPPPFDLRLLSPDRFA